MNGSLCHVGPRRGCAHVTVIRFGPDAQPGINSELAGGRHRVVLAADVSAYCTHWPDRQRADLAYSGNDAVGNAWPQLVVLQPGLKCLKWKYSQGPDSCGVRSFKAIPRPEKTPRTLSLLPPVSPQPASAGDPSATDVPLTPGCRR
jgi:hypothetical protein